MSLYVFILQNHILLTCIKSNFTPFANFYYFPTLSVKLRSIFFFSSSEMHQSHHFVACHATDFYLLKHFAFLKFIMPSQSSDIINYSGSSSSKLLLSSRLILSRTTPRIPVSFVKAVTLLKSSSKRVYHN